MKFSVLQENLTHALSIVRRAVPSRSTLPITANVLLATENSMLKMSTTDLSMAMTLRIGAKVDEEGAITVPVRLLSDLMNTMPNERVDIELIDEPFGISLKCGTFTSQISGTPANDFPPVPTVEDGIVAKIERKTLRQAIDRTAFAAASENSRPILCGVKVRIEGDDFTFASADGFRLAIAKGKLSEQPEKDMEFLIPANTLTEIGRLLGSTDELVEFTVTENSNQALFKVGDVEIVTNLLSGTFPDYMKLVPQSSATKVTMDVASFLSATRTASIFATGDANAVRLRITSPEDSDKGTTTLIAHNPEVGNNEGQVPATVEGKDISIGFNFRYLIAVLDVIDGDIEIGMNSPATPGLLKMKDSDDYIHVIMPIFMQHD